MNSSPILFRYRDVVVGKGYVAVVEASGRALLSQEEDCYWFYGVEPGGIAGGAPDLVQAGREFKKTYLSVLFDIAAEAGSFAEFQREVEDFFHATNSQAAADWEEAHTRVKSGEADGDSMVGSMPRRVNPAGSSIRIEEVELDDADSGPTRYNVVPEPEYAEAA